MEENEETLQNQLNTLGKIIDLSIDECVKPENKMGFCLLLYDFGKGDDDRKLYYISNSNRDDVVKAMEEFIEKTRGDNYGKHIK